MAEPRYLDDVKLWLRARSILHGQGSEILYPPWEWFDLSDGGTADLRNAVTGTCPTFNHDSVNSRPGVLFDGVDNVLESVVNANICFNTSQKTLLIAFRVVAFGSDVASYNNNDGLFVCRTSGFGLTFRATGQLLNFYNVDTGGVKGFSIAIDTDVHVAFMAHNGTTMYGAVDSLDSLSSVASGPTTSLADVLRMGRGPGVASTYYSNIEVFEVLGSDVFFDPTAVERSVLQNLMCYMQTEHLDRGDPLAAIQDRGARRLWSLSSPISEAALELGDAGIDPEVGDVVGVADDVLPMPSGIDPSSRATEAWRQNAVLVTNQSLTFTPGGRA